MASANNTGYEAGLPGAPSGSGEGLSRLKRAYLSYLETKNAEIEEQQDARRYYHGSQWTEKQIKEFNRRRQPVVTYNRVGRKINAVVGLLERQRQDPRAYPRTPKHEDGAEIATAVLRYILDQQEWSAKSPEVGLDAAVDGVGGIEVLLEEGDEGDPEIAFEVVDPSSFFYDPRSLKPDFSDARYMGIGKWADVETAVEMFPDKEDEIKNSVGSGDDLTSNPDSDEKWMMVHEGQRKLRIVDHWYIKDGEWHWCIYTGTLKLAEGRSYLFDEKGKTVCKYVMFSANVDQDGDRYGFVRNMKSAQDEINQRRSKGLHITMSRRVVAQRADGDKVEDWRREAARPDGVFLYNNEPPQFDDQARAQELQAQLAFGEEAKNEIENYGFNPALIGTGVQDMSGRAINMLQQAGIAELGPYILSSKAWKIRVYRILWNTAQRMWTAERAIRVTDDEGAPGFFMVNQLTVDPRTGMPVIVNKLDALDVDIIIDEGPDVVNMQADAYDTLSVMGAKGVGIPPEVIIELSPLHASKKRKVLAMLQQAKQEQVQVQQAVAQSEMQSQQIDNAKKAAEIDKTRSETMENIADARQTQMETDLLPLERLSQQQASVSI